MNFKLLLQSTLFSILLLVASTTTAKPLTSCLVDTIRPTLLGITCQSQELFIGEKDCVTLPYQFCVEATDDQSSTNHLSYKLSLDLKTDAKVDTSVSQKCIDFHNGLPVGKHSLRIIAFDTAGNFAECFKEIKVLDTIKPVARAKYIRVSLWPGFCRATVDVSSVNSGSTDNCSGANKLRYRLEYTAKLQIGSLMDVFCLPTELTFGSTELDAQNVTLFVIDESNNWSTVDAVIFVANDYGCDWGCMPTTTLAVSQMDEFGQSLRLEPKSTCFVDGIARVQVDTVGKMLVMLRNYPYKCELKNNYNVSNGVTTSDLISINKHILQTDTIASPYKKIAADINADGKISTADLVELRKIVLHLKDTFESNTSYRFVNSSYNFEDPNPTLNPIDHVKVSATIGSNVRTSFIAIKIGDVNNSIKQGFQEIGDRRASSLAVSAPEGGIKNGTIQKMAFKSDPQLDGWQSTIKVDPSKAKILAVDGLPFGNFNASFFEKGLIPISLLKGESDGSFSIIIEGLYDGTMESAVSLTGELLPSLSYDGAAELPLVLRFEHPVVEAFELLQNVPNPFEGKTLIGMVFTEATAATMTIFDATGKTLKVIQGDYAKGYNEVAIDQADLKATGMLSYRLTTDKYSSTKQMVITQ